MTNFFLKYVLVVASVTPPPSGFLPTALNTPKSPLRALLYPSIFYFIYFIYLFFTLGLFIYLFLAVLGLRFCARVSLVAASGGHSSSRCAGLSLSRPLLLRSTGSRRAGLVIVAHGPSCFEACGILPDQGSNLCPLHWQADSQPLHHEGSPPSFKYWCSFRVCPGSPSILILYTFPGQFHPLRRFLSSILISSKLTSPAEISFLSIRNQSID